MSTTVRVAGFDKTAQSAGFEEAFSKAFLENKVPETIQGIVWDLQEAIWKTYDAGAVISHHPKGDAYYDDAKNAIRKVSDALTVAKEASRGDDEVWTLLNSAVMLRDRGDQPLFDAEEKEKGRQERRSAEEEWMIENQ
jgi:hypothetical protein